MYLTIGSYEDRADRTDFCHEVVTTIMLDEEDKLTSPIRATLLLVKTNTRAYGPTQAKVLSFVCCDNSSNMFKATLNSGRTHTVDMEKLVAGATLTITKYKVIKMTDVKQAVLFVEEFEITLPPMQPVISNSRVHANDLQPFPFDEAANHVESQETVSTTVTHNDWYAVTYDYLVVERIMKDSALEIIRTNVTRDKSLFYLGAE